MRALKLLISIAALALATFGLGACEDDPFVPTNNPPIADAGPDVTVAITQTHTFDAANSRDFDGDKLRFAWTLLSAPFPSFADVENASQRRASITPDAEGEYRLVLIVSDGAAAVADTVTVNAVACDVQPQTLAFGNYEIDGGSINREFTITNRGAAVLSGNITEACAPFSIVSGGGAFSLAESETRTVVVRLVTDGQAAGAISCDIQTGLVDCPIVTATGFGGASFAAVSSAMASLGCEGGPCHFGTTSYDWMVARVDLSDPPNSAIFGRPFEAGHSGGNYINSSLGPGGSTYNLIIEWIEQGVPSE